MIELPGSVFCPVCQADITGSRMNTVPVWNCARCGLTVRLSAAQLAEAMQRLHEGALAAPALSDADAATLAVVREAAGSG